MRLPVVGSAYSHGRTEVTARAAKNLWFEARPDGEKAPVLCTHLPKKTNYTMGTTITSPLSIVTTDLGYTYIIGTTQVHGLVTGSSTVDWTSNLAASFTAGWRVDVATDSATVVMVQSNNAQRVGVTGGTVSAITLPDSQQALSVAWLRGYFVILTTTGRLYFSTDGSTWNALAFATAEASPDAGAKIMAVGNLLMVCGMRSIEFWAPSGNPDIPFMPMTEVVLRIGVPWPNSACLIDGQPYFWGSPSSGPRGLFTLEGQNAVRLSSPDFERIVASGGSAAPWVSGFSMFGRRVVHIKPTPSDSTWWFDLSTGAYTEITSGSPFAGDVEYTTNWAGVYGVVRTEDTRHFLVDPSNYDTTVARELITDHVVTPDLDRFTVDKVRLDVAADSTVSLAVSRDGGSTWGSSRTSDASGTRGVKGIVQFDRYGTAPQFTFKVGATGKFVLSNLIINPRN